MEWVLRHAQRTMPPSQVGVVCKNAGQRYRWVGLASLLVVGASGLLMVLRTDSAELAARAGQPELGLSDAYGQTLAALALAWCALLGAVSAMAFWLHPAQAKRSRPHMTEDEIRAERSRIGVAINRMERILRFELVVAIVAVALGASLNFGGAW